MVRPRRTRVLLTLPDEAREGSGAAGDAVSAGDGCVRRATARQTQNCAGESMGRQADGEEKQTADAAAKRRGKKIERAANKEAANRRRKKGNKTAPAIARE